MLLWVAPNTIKDRVCCRLATNSSFARHGYWASAGVNAVKRAREEAGRERWLCRDLPAAAGMETGLPAAAAVPGRALSAPHGKRDAADAKPSSALVRPAGCATL